MGKVIKAVWREVFQGQENRLFWKTQSGMAENTFLFGKQDWIGVSRVQSILKPFEFS